ncbi:MAG: hypothetical protein OEV85_14440 [Candidatus Thorarchaeota archaeon]|nr:hypothetical protein [Candidatus Thorarchaeota archaeon]
MNNFIVIDSPTILVIAIPYVIARVAIKNERRRIYGCITCFTLWLLASCMILIQSFSFQSLIIGPFTIETFIVLMIALVLDLVAQIRSLQ